MSIKVTQNTEQSILEAATNLFVEKGFASTSTTEIAKVAGCNQAAVHYYFRTKEKLFESIFENIFKFFVSRFLEISSEDIPFEAKLKKKIETHFDLLKKNRRIPLFLVNEVITNPKRLAMMKEKLGDLPKQLFEKFQIELDIEIEKGNIRAMDALDLMLTIVSLNVSLHLVGPLFKVIANLSENEFDELVDRRKDEHVRIILGSIHP